MSKEFKIEILLLAVSAASLIVSVFNLTEFNAAWIAVLLCGIPIIYEAATGLVTRLDIKADVLVSIALISALVIGEVFAAGEVAFIMRLGSLLEELTVMRARAGIETLVKLSPDTARIIRNGEEVVIPSKDVAAGDILRIFPGETIAADGIIIKGTTSVDQSIVTGEPIPVDKKEGDSVQSGTINCFGAFDMKAVCCGEDSSLQRMIALVQSADAEKAKIVKLADKWATWIVVAALSLAVLTFALTGEAMRAVTVLVVFCPCALVLATPAAIMAAIGNLTKHGLLVKEGDALERLAQVETACLDKTGTLTYGNPEVSRVHSVSSLSDDELYCIIASAESLSEHPLGRAIVSGYHGKLSEVEKFTMIPGKGITASVDGKNVIVGNSEFLMDFNISPKCIDTKGCTVVYAAVNSQYAGYVVLSDKIRQDAYEAVASIKESGVVPVLITGDNRETAMTVASQAGISEVYYECMPENKLKIIDEYQQSGRVCMIGDGINDSPALKKAHVGIAMGAGSDMAVESADIVLIRNDISQLGHLFALSKRMMSTIKFNIVFSLGLNFAAIGLAMIAVLDPVSGALIHNLGSVAVVINSALLLKWKKSGSGHIRLDAAESKHASV